MTESSHSTENEDVGLRDAGYVTFRLEGQWLGLPVVAIQEVIAGQSVARVPLSPPEVQGFLNLRGQVVTAIDLRSVLGLEARAEGEPFINVVIQDEGEFFSFIVDEVGDVLEVGEHGVEPTPKTLSPVWSRCCSGVVRMERELMVVLDVDTVLGDGASKVA